MNNKVYLTIIDGVVTNCYSDTEIDVAVINLDALSQQDIDTNEEMLHRYEDGELIEIEIQ
jgi:hypothetical protein